MKGVKYPLDTDFNQYNASSKMFTHKLDGHVITEMTQPERKIHTDAKKIEQIYQCAGTTALHGFAHTIVSYFVYAHTYVFE
jgi:hypothetical protein